MTFLLVLLFIILISLSLSLKSGKKKTVGKHLSAASTKFPDKKENSFKKNNGKDKDEDDEPTDG